MVDEVELLTWREVVVISVVRGRWRGGGGGGGGVSNGGKLLLRSCWHFR